jgi:uncharacterized protein (TIGR00369 family)
MPTTRMVTFDDPGETARDAESLSGIEFLRRMIAEQRRIPIGVTLGFRLVEVSEGVGIFEAEAGPWAFNPLGAVHGGWYATVLDSALGVALHSTLPAGVSYTTLEFKTNIVRSVKPDTGVLRATGRIVHRGRTTAVTEARLEDAKGVLFAHATSTLLIFGA